MNEKAKEKGPFYVVTALYGLVVAVGFGADAPPLGPTGLFLATLTLVVFGHIFNANQVASIRHEYPHAQFIIDFGLVAVLAVMFNMLAHPVSGGFLRFRRPWVTADEFLKAMDPSALVGVALQEHVRNAFFHFFVLSFVALGLFVLWHVLLLPSKDLKLRKTIAPYFVGWGIFALVAGCGVLKTRSATADVEQMITWLNGLGTFSIAGAAVFLLLETGFDWTYVAPRAPGEGQETVAGPQRSLPPEQGSPNK